MEGRSDVDPFVQRSPPGETLGTLALVTVTEVRIAREAKTEPAAADLVQSASGEIATKDLGRKEPH
jgi:hypothetical protein